LKLESYPKIWRWGVRNAGKLFGKGHIVVQEKIDGSQVSFGTLRDGLYIRSRGAEIDLDAPDKLFATLVAEVTEKRNLLLPGYLYRGEFLTKPKHNVIKYDKIPQGHVVLFDVQADDGHYLSPYGVGVEAQRLGMQQVPTFLEMDHDGVNPPFDEGDLNNFLTRESCLGGSLIEGVVVKNYNQMTPFGTPTFAKFVSQAFKEAHQNEWKVRTDKLEDLVKFFHSPMRFEKAVQHLRDNGELQEDPRDIGLLFKEVASDFEAEEIDDVKEKLWTMYRKKILKGVTVGLAEWYKARLTAHPETNGPTIDSDTSADQ
jgi:hypothetical protein